jgi:hypothetical protein
MTETKTSRFRFFLPDARLLDKEEIAQLPPQKKQAAAAADKPGVWLELSCPDDSCIDSQGNINIPAQGVESTENKGLFFKLFCPEDSCEVIRPTDLP